jgi:Aminoglycoside-2''-adenylyltransferase
MHPAEVTEVLHRLERNGIEAWLTGAWAEAALAGDERAVHPGLQLVVEERNADGALVILDAAGWRLLEGEPAGSFVVVDASGARLEVTTRAAIDGGRGTLDGRSVRVAR